MSMLDVWALQQCFGGAITFGFDMGRHCHHISSLVEIESCPRVWIEELKVYNLRIVFQELHTFLGHSEPILVSKRHLKIQ